MKTFRTPALYFLLAVLTAVLMAPASGQSADDAASKSLAMAMSTSHDGHARYAPNFTLRLTNGEDFNLADNIGKKVIVLNFFATWCGPCKIEMPELSSYYDKHRDEGLVIIGVDAGDSEAKVEKFIKKYGVTFPVGIDHEDDLIDLYRIRNVPVSVLIGADGTVRLFHPGPIWDAEATFGPHLKESLELIKSGKAIDKDTYLKKLAEQT